MVSSILALVGPIYFFVPQEPKFVIPIIVTRDPSVLPAIEPFGLHPQLVKFAAEKKWIVQRSETLMFVLDPGLLRQDFTEGLSTFTDLVSSKNEEIDLGSLSKDETARLGKVMQQAGLPLGPDCDSVFFGSTINLTFPDGREATLMIDPKPSKSPSKNWKFQAAEPTRVSLTVVVHGSLSDGYTTVLQKEAFARLEKLKAAETQKRLQIAENFFTAMLPKGVTIPAGLNKETSVDQLDPQSQSYILENAIGPEGPLTSLRGAKMKVYVFAVTRHGKTMSRSSLSNRM